MNFINSGKKILKKIRLYLIAKVGKFILNLLFSTCKIQIEGLKDFIQIAKSGPCILILWHNRLTIMPYLLSRYTPETRYAAVISASRDGEILSTIVNSFKNGHTIQVGHKHRYQALREMIDHVKQAKYVVVITPDGPRGPCYEVKPGTALAAIETQAQIVTINWEADHMWKLKTWDQLRFPRPFSTVTVRFKAAVKFEKDNLPSLEQAKKIIQEALP